MNINIHAIKHRVQEAAEDLASCDTEALIQIARDIVQLLGREELTPVERALLSDAASHLLCSEAQGRAPWRQQAAQTALRVLNRLDVVANESGDHHAEGRET